MQFSAPVLTKIILSVSFILGTFLFRWVIGKIIRRHVIKNNIAESRKFYIVKLFNIFLFILLISLLSVLWDLSYERFTIIFTSFFAVAGIGLFASWSILSNVTASVILFFYFPYRVGSKIKIIDGDNSISGQISDITLFYIRVSTEEGNIVSYPNNLALQKPIQMLEEKIK